MKIVQDEASGGVWNGQPAYIEALLQQFGMEHAKPSATPVDPGNKLVKASKEDELFDQHSISLQLKACCTCLSLLDLTSHNYAVSNVARFSANPSIRHWTAVKRMMRYLRGTTDLGVIFTAQGNNDCGGFSDADWAGDVDDRKSTSENTSSRLVVPL